MTRQIKKVRKIEVFVAYDAGGEAHTLEIWQLSLVAATKDDPHATVHTLKEVRTVDDRPVNRISDDEFVILDARFPGGLTVRRRR